MMIPGPTDPERRDCPEMPGVGSRVGRRTADYCAVVGTAARRDRTLPLDHRIRTTMLEVKVTALQKETEALRAELGARRSEVASLESELAELEETVARKDRELQRTIDRYEALLAKKDRAYRECITETGRVSDDSKSDSTRGLLPGLLDWLDTGD